MIRPLSATLVLATPLSLAVCRAPDELREWPDDTGYVPPPDPFEGLPVGEVAWRESEAYAYLNGCVATDGSLVFARVNYYQPLDVGGLEMATGERKWWHDDEGTSYFREYGGSLVLYLDGGRRLHGLDPATGEQRWTTPELASEWAIPTPYGDGAYANVAVDLATGAVVWSRDDLTPSAPAEVDDAQVYFFEEYGRRLYALDRASGETSWVVEMPDNSCGGSYFCQRPASDGERLYAPSEESLCAFDTTDGSVVWCRRPVYAGDPAWGQPRVADGRVFAWEGGAFVARSAETGEPLWAERLGVAMYSGALPPRPTVQDGLVYLYGTDDQLRVFDAATGAAVWASEFVAEGGSTCAPLVVGDEYVILADPSGVGVVRNPL